VPSLLATNGDEKDPGNSDVAVVVGGWRCGGGSGSAAPVIVVIVLAFAVDDNDDDIPMPWYCNVSIRQTLS